MKKGKFMKLDDIRNKVDQLDDKLLALLVRRLALAKKAGFIKKESLQPIEDRLREKAVLKRIKTRVKDLGLSVSFAESIFKLVIAEAKKNQTEKT